MKTLTTYITEKLKITKDNIGYEHKYFPETKRELQELLKQLIEERGLEGDFNDIDTSNITDMSDLFFESKFNGDISQWDVSNVKNMQFMFKSCISFNQSLNDWNVSNVTDMR